MNKSTPIEHDAEQATTASRFMSFHKLTARKSSQFLRLFFQLLLVVLVSFAGNLLAAALPFPLPGNIVGMVLLLALLGTGILKTRSVDNACNCLLSNMSFFFIPASVSIMGCISLIEGNVVKFILICVITTLLVFVSTAYTVMFVSRLLAQKHKTSKSKEA